MSRLRVDFFRTLEAGIVGLVFVQAVRFLYATLYARASSADLVQRTPGGAAAVAGVPGVVELHTVQSELVVLAGLLLLPLLALVIGRWRISIPFSVLLIAMGRSLALQAAELKVPATALVVGAGMLYLALLVMRRPAVFPAALLLGVAGDQLIRAAFNTYDRTWQGDYTIDIAGTNQEMGTLIAFAAIALIALTIATWYVERRAVQIAAQQAERDAPPSELLQRGRMNVWGGLAFGAILFLEFTLFGLPNAVAHWSGVDYAALVPWLVAATLLPLVPEVREQARRFAGMFDIAWRGWLWVLLLGLLLVIGRQYDGVLAAIMLVAAQFMVGLTLWWVYRTHTGGPNLTGITLLFSLLSFGVLAVGDYFSYDYAYVRDLSDPYQNVSDFLRAFRDMGLGLTLIAALVLSIPIILTRRGIAWSGGRSPYTFVGLLVVLGASFVGASATSGNVIRRPANPDCLRIATLNIHGGYSQYFNPNLERVAQVIELNGADIVLLQEVDTGRMASFGVDQALWLARRLQMEWTFYPQNEELQGLAVLSRVPIAAMQGLDLPSEGNQAAVMHVTLDPERLVADPEAGNVGNLHVYNAWLGFRVAQRDGQPVPEGEQDQNRQLDTMLRWVAAQHGPAWKDRIVLGGTFNFPPDSPLYRALNSPVFKDPFAGLRAEDTMTVFLVDGTAARFDYLWTASLPLNSAGIDHSPEAAQASDHRSAIIAISRREGIQCAP